MQKPPIILLQQRDFGQKMNISFEFVTQNIGPLIKSLAVITGPPALLTGIAQGMFQSNSIAAIQSNNVYGPFSQYMSIDYFLVAIFSLITYFLAWASVSAFMVLYEERGSSQTITPALVWNKIMENIGASILAQILSFILILVGMLFFIIPGFYLAVSLQLFMMITVREKLPAIDSLKRSYELNKGKWWSTFGLILIMSIVTGIVGLVFQLPAIMVTVMSTLGLGSGIANAKPFLIGASALAMVGTTIVQGLIWVAVAFQYYNLMERSEGTGLRAEIESLGKGDVERSNDDDRF